MKVLRGVEGPDDALAQVQKAADKGYRFIKIWVDDRGGGQEKLSEDVYRPLIAEASRRDIAVFAHQQAATDMPPLIDAGVSGFLHGRLGPTLGAEIALAAADRGTFIVPNLGLWELRQETIGRDPFLSVVLPEGQAGRLVTTTEQRRVRPLRDEAREEELRASLASLRDAGVDIVLGTDAGALPDHPFGYSGHRELEILVRLGMSPMQALVAATGNAARHFRQSDLGLIAPGRRADFLVLEKNPLEDIRNTRAIHAVYLGGQRVDREAIAEALRRP
jgi:imidazolonepropionase-like amidohydrolase